MGVPGNAWRRARAPGALSAEGRARATLGAGQLEMTNGQAARTSAGGALL